MVNDVARRAKRVVVPYRDRERVRPYEAALRAVGVEPVVLSVAGIDAAQATKELSNADGLLLMGGTDVNPALYGQAPEPETDMPDDERDALEFALIGAALERDVPLLAICRGAQLLNVQQGGTLIQHRLRAR